MHIRVISLASWSAASKIIGMIKKITARLKIDSNLELIIVKTIEEAVKYRHIGGPTIQINGLDIEPEARDVEQFGLAWRKYGVSSIPSEKLIESAIIEATGKIA